MKIKPPLFIFSPPSLCFFLCLPLFPFSCFLYVHVPPFWSLALFFSSLPHKAFRAAQLSVGMGSRLHSGHISSSGRVLLHPLHPLQQSLRGEGTINVHWFPHSGMHTILPYLGVYVIFKILILGHVLGFSRTTFTCSLSFIGFIVSLHC